MTGEGLLQHWFVLLPPLKSRGYGICHAWKTEIIKKWLWFDSLPIQPSYSCDHASGACSLHVVRKTWQIKFLFWSYLGFLWRAKALLPTWSNRYIANLQSERCNFYFFLCHMMGKFYVSGPVFAELKAVKLASQITVNLSVSVKENVLWQK